MAVDVGVADLVRSYVRLRDAASNVTEGSANLLLYYGVECGLKAAYLGKKGIGARGTQNLPQELRNHDLRRLAKALRLDSDRSQELLACRRAHSSELNVEHNDLHQAWRYGAALNSEDEERAIRALIGLSDWCRKEHNR